MFRKRKPAKTVPEQEPKPVNLPSISLDGSFFENKKDPKQMSTLSLAFMGDAVFEVLTRSYIVSNNQSAIGNLHSENSEIVNASAQFRAAKLIFDNLTEAEREVFMRGRNAHTAHTPKNKTAEEYRYATALETLFGYLYLSGQTDRLYILFEMILRDLNERKESQGKG